MRQRVYLETTIASYLTAWLSPQLVVAAQQQTTRTWWENRREKFDLFVSQVVIDEARSGDPNAAARRLAVLADIPLLGVTQAAIDLASHFLSEVPLPAKAQADSLHIAISAVNGIDFLLTWNCTHIANAAFRAKINSISRKHGYDPPIICTPNELMQE